MKRPEYPVAAQMLDIASTMETKQERLDFAQRMIEAAGEIISENRITYRERLAEFAHEWTDNESTPIWDAPLEFRG